MYEFLFLLSHPNHRLYKVGDGPHRESLEFQDAKIVKNILNNLHISVERSNGEQGDRFATVWETKKCSDITPDCIEVTIHNADALDNNARKHDEINDEENLSDLILVDRSFGFFAHVHLPSERFSRLLQINLKERRINLLLTNNTEQAIEGLKFPLSEDAKDDYRKGNKVIRESELGLLKIEIEGYNIVIQELPEKLTTESG